MKHMENWYALYTKPHKEHHVRSLLENRGFETYLPIIQVRVNGKKKTVPFFSCYLFVRLASDATSSVRWTPGLRRILSFGEAPAAVPDDAISLIQRRVAKMGDLGYAVCRFKSGEQVVIRGGPLKCFEAVFDRALSNRDRAMILVEMLGQWTRCEVDVSYLEKFH